MQIFPVLDLMNGQVVRGIAGLRESYRPVQSVLTSSAQPLEVAKAFQMQLGLSQFYIADLDAIQHRTPQLTLLCELHAAFPGFWLDIGVRSAADIPESLISKDITFVLGLETLTGPGVLREVCQNLDAQRVVFSLDLKHSHPLGDLTGWKGATPWDIAREAIEIGVKQILVLDLAQVGTGGGLSTLALCQQIKQEFPELKVITGGGIRTADDLIALNQTNLDGVLIASAFHDGSIGREDLSL